MPAGIKIENNGRIDMNVIEVNAIGKPCPQPVVMTKKALSEAGKAGVVVFVDNEAARDNVVKMAEKGGRKVTAYRKTKKGFKVEIKKSFLPEKKKPGNTKKVLSKEKIVYLFESDFIGTNRELGKVLSNGFLNAIEELPERKSSIVLISKGVKLAIKKSYVLNRLKSLEEKGFDILICGTCLDYFKIREKVDVGKISNALEIMECMTEADKVIKF
jgi:tRNA 2-thiouridine synthesizing protein A